MSFFLAVDVGGTKTDYLLADDTHELTRVRGGTIKRMRADDATATANLEAALAELTALSGIAITEISRTCIGTAGETVALVTDWLRSAFRERVPGDLILLGDIEIALDAAFPGQPGVLVLVGTGSNIAGRDAAGRVTSVGGWGPALADQGSGHSIGHNALRAMFLALDEGIETQLFPAVLDFWQLTSVDAIVEFANRLPPPDFSRLTHLVLDCANHGDPVASAVLKRAGEEIGHLVCLIMRRLRAVSTSHDWMPPIAFAGSIMGNVAPVREALVAAIKREFPAVRTLDGVVDPIAGALWRVRNQAAGYGHVLSADTQSL